MSLYKRLILISLITTLMILAGWIALLLVADYQADKAENSLKEWRSQQRIPDEDEWQEANTQINSALKFDPANPGYLEKLAELYRWESILNESTHQERDTANRNALKFYRQLLQLKPSWPNYWGGLVQTKQALWEYDNEMNQALQNAAHYGPWFKNNQRIILRVGYQGWAFLDKETQQTVSGTLERAIKIQPKQTIQLALNSGFTDHIMPYLEEDKGLMNWYKREIADRKKKLDSL